MGKLRILHSSDLHGRYKPLLNALAAGGYDLWVDTGDFLPNKLWGMGLGNPDVEVPHQARWLQWKALGVRIRDALAAGRRATAVQDTTSGRSAGLLDPVLVKTPVVMVAGNHDYVDMVDYLQGYGVNAIGVSVASGVQSIRIPGVDRPLRVQGLRQVLPCNNPYGTWRGELDPLALDGLVATMSQAASTDRPDLLVTHSPALGLLDAVGGGDDGIGGLRDLLHRHSSFVAHLHGHVHRSGGQTLDWQRSDGSTVRTVNGATHVRIVDVDWGDWMG